MKKTILTYTLKFPSEKAMKKSIERDILQGGIYVAATVLPVLNQNVKLKLFIEKIKEPLELYGRVVRVVDEKTSKITGEKVGFAVQIENLSEELKNELLKISRGFADRKVKIHGRRRSPRKKVNIPVEVIYKENTFQGRAVEISLYGAYIILKGVMIEEGEEITVIFRGEGFGGEKTPAKVVYYFPPQKAMAYGKDEGIGVEFKELSENLYMLIYSIFENQKT